MSGQKKIAIVYDWIDKWGGVERILLQLHEIFPQAVFYTSYFDAAKAPWAKSFKIKTSFIQRLPDFIKKNRILSLLLYPFAFESFDFSGYDTVISVSSAFAKGIVTKPGTVHICYLLTPTRYLWLYPEMYLKSPLINFFLSPFVRHLKRWDFVAAQRPDQIYSISKTVADRCMTYYKRKSEVVYPGFDIAYWNNVKLQMSNDKSISNFKIQNSKYFLVVSRLEPYKKVDIVVNVFNKQTESKLIVVGKGSTLNKLKNMAKSNISFLQDITDEELGGLYQNAQGLIMPQEEDFGYTALEAQFFGCPIIAYKKGGVLETVQENKTGIFFSSQTSESLTDTLERFKGISYNLRRETEKFGKENIERFKSDIFAKKIKEYIT